MAAVLVTACGSGEPVEAPTMTSATPTLTTPAVTDSPTDSAAESLLTEEELADLREALAARGVDAALLEALMQAAIEAGYLSSTQEVSEEEQLTLAYVSMEDCDSVAAGVSTWEDLIRGAVEEGIPRNRATVFAQFMEMRFCPALTEPAGPATPTATGTATPTATAAPTNAPTAPMPPAPPGSDEVCPVLDDLSPSIEVTDTGERTDLGVAIVDVAITVTNPRDYPLYLFGLLDYRASNDEITNLFTVDPSGIYAVELAPGQQTVSVRMEDYGGEAETAQLVWVSWVVDGSETLSRDAPCTATAADLDWG